MKTVLLLLLFFLVTCSFASENVTDEVSLLSNKLQIVKENKQCFLIYNSSMKILTPKPPCYFLRNSKQKPQYFSYSDVEADAVLIVVGTPVSKVIRKEWGLPENLICGVEAQGVIIKKNEILTTKKTLKGGVLCRDKGSDEKNFWYFAHE